MKVFYYKEKRGNFGDDLNEWIWQELWPDIPTDRTDDFLLIGIGTIIGLKLPEGKTRKLVLGSGTGYLEVAPLDESWEFFAVRGPLSARALSLPDETAITDAAALLRLTHHAEPTTARRGVLFMPHTSADLGNWERVCKRIGVKYLSPRWDSKYLLEQLNSAELVLADAMHSAICADTLRVPWLPLAISPNINSFKWYDWTMSLKLEYNPTYLPASGVIEWLMNKAISKLTIPYRMSEEMVAKINSSPAEATDLIICHQTRRSKLSPSELVRLERRERLVWKTISRGLRLMSMTPFRLIFAPIDYFMIRNAARRLESISQTEGNLSDEKVLDEAVARLSEALERVKMRSMNI